MLPVISHDSQLRCLSVFEETTITLVFQFVFVQGLLLILRHLYCVRLLAQVEEPKLEWLHEVVRFHLAGRTNEFSLLHML